MMEMLDEKEAMERETADAFLRLYNSQMACSYDIVKHSDAPDFVCGDKSGRELRLEITLTEDRPGDIQGLVGRSDAGSLEALKRHVRAVEAGEAHPLEWTSCLQGNVLSMVVNRIQRKLEKDYGPHAALVVRDTSPIPWSWHTILGDIAGSLDLKNNPFDEGIWIISFARNEIFRIV
jgi:hypothetical protein